MGKEGVTNRKKSHQITEKDLAIKLSRKLRGNQHHYMLFKKLFIDYIDRVIEKMLQGKIYKMPMRLGFFNIVKTKPLSKVIDWGTSNQYNKIIYYKNFHSDGYMYKIAWYKKNEYAIFTNKTRYCFRPSRTFKHRLRDIILTEHTDFQAWNISRSKQL